MDFYEYLISRNYSASTAKAYERKLLRLESDILGIAAKPLAECSFLDLMHLVEVYEVRYGRTYLLNVVKILNMFFEYAGARVFLDKKLINCRKIKENHIYIRDNTKKALSRRIPIFHRIVILLLYGYGFSVSEALSLKVSDFDFSLGVIKTRLGAAKFEDDDEIYFRQYCIGKKEYLLENDFCARVSRATIYNIIKKYGIRNLPKDNKIKNMMQMLDSGKTLSDVKRAFNYKSYSFIKKMEGGK